MSTPSPSPLPPPKPDSIRVASADVAPSLVRANAAARRRKRREARVAERNRSRVIWIFTILAVVVLAAIIADTSGVLSRLRAAQTPGGISTPGDAASILATLSTAPRYRDPAGHFSVAVPPNWRVLRADPDSIFDAAFRGPYGLEMNIQCVATNGLTFEKLVGRLKTLEHSMAANSHIAVLKINDWKAAKRSLQLYKNKILMLDFVTGDLAHHLQFVIPPALYDEYEPVFIELVRQTYVPGTIIPVE